MRPHEQEIRLEPYKKEIIEAYQSGISGRKLGKKYLCHYNTIIRFLVKNNITINKQRSMSCSNKGKTSPMKGKRLSPERIEEIRKRVTGNKFCVGRKYSKETIAKMRRKRLEYLKLNPDTPKILRNKKTKLTLSEIKFKEQLRSKYKNLLRRLIRLNWYTKKGKTNEILGFGYKEFKEHIESQFREGMDWHIKESFHIDHIIPIDVFIKNNITDPKIVNCLINLQPLYPKENRAKGVIYNIENFQNDLEKINQFLTASRINGKTVYTKI